MQALIHDDKLGRSQLRQRGIESSERLGKLAGWWRKRADASLL